MKLLYNKAYLQKRSSSSLWSDVNTKKKKNCMNVQDKQVLTQLLLSLKWIKHYAMSSMVYE